MLLVIILIIPYFLFGFCSRRRRIHIMTKDKIITKLQKNKNKKTLNTNLSYYKFIRQNCILYYLNYLTL